MADLPEPLTPADCDLRGLPYMPMDVTRLLDSDFWALSTGEEFKAGVALWAKSWLQVPAASLPDDDRVLAHLSGAGPRWKKMREMTLHGWIKCADGRLYHPTVAEKARDAWKARLAQRERAAKRWHKNDDAEEAKNDAVAYPTGDATALPRDMQGRGKGSKEEEEKIKPSNPTQPESRDDFATVCIAAGLAPKRRTEAERKIWLGWVGLGLDGEDISNRIKFFLAEHPGSTNTLGRFDAAMHDAAARLTVAKLPLAQPIRPVSRAGEGPAEHSIRERLAAEIGEKTARCWIDPCGFRLNGEALHVTAPNETAASFIGSHFIDKLKALSGMAAVELTTA